MASPKSGKLCTLVPPAGPKKPHEADNANPGEVEEVKAEQRKTESGKYGEASVSGHKPGEKSEESEEKKSWIEILLHDQDDEPVAGEPYRVTLPDGSTVAEGTLDDEGKARVDGIDPGECKVTFFKRDKSCWKAQ